MNTFEMTKKNYERGQWSKEMLKAMVAKGKLSAMEFKAITGESYSA